MIHCIKNKKGGKEKICPGYNGANNYRVNDAFKTLRSSLNYPNLCSLFPPIVIFSIVVNLCLLGPLGIMPGVFYTS